MLGSILPQGRQLSGDVLSAVTLVAFIGPYERISNIVPSWESFRIIMEAKYVQPGGNVMLGHLSQEASKNDYKLRQCCAVNYIVNLVPRSCLLIRSMVSVVIPALICMVVIWTLTWVWSPHHTPLSVLP